MTTAARSGRSWGSSRSSDTRWGQAPRSWATMASTMVASTKSRMFPVSSASRFASTPGFLGLVEGTRAPAGQAPGDVELALRPPAAPTRRRPASPRRPARRRRRISALARRTARAARSGSDAHGHGHRVGRRRAAVAQAVHGVGPQGEQLGVAGRDGQGPVDGGQGVGVGTDLHRLRRGPAQPRQGVAVPAGGQQVVRRLAPGERRAPPVGRPRRRGRRPARRPSTVAVRRSRTRSWRKR